MRRIWAPEWKYITEPPRPHPQILFQIHIELGDHRIWIWKNRILMPAQQTIFSSPPHLTLSPTRVPPIWLRPQQGPKIVPPPKILWKYPGCKIFISNRNNNHLLLTTESSNRTHAWIGKKIPWERQIRVEGYLHTPDTSGTLPQNGVMQGPLWSMHGVLQSRAALRAQTNST